jgi:DNA-binding response OmpR family regulator
VVDDDEALNRLICLFLERNGFQVLSAADALQAMYLLEQHEDIRLAIVDLMLPHIDGIALVRQIKARASRPDLPVIMISASTDELKIDQSLRSGVGLFLEKPVDFDRLLALARFSA